MKKTCFQNCLLLLMVFCWVVPAVAERFETQYLKQLNLPTTPLDVAISPNEKWFYILTSGSLHVFSLVTDKLESSFPVEPGVDKMVHYPKDNALVLINSENKTIRVLRMSVIHEFDLSGNPFLGPEEAPVTLVLFTHYQCPYCARLDSTIEEVRQFFGDDVKIVFKAYPNFEEVSRRAWATAIAADRQGKFWDFHHELHQVEMPLEIPKIEAVARKVGLDMEKLAKDVEGNEILKLIERDVREGIAADVHSVPTIFINGVHFKTENLEQLPMVIQEKLAVLKSSEKSGDKTKGADEKKSD